MPDAPLAGIAAGAAGASNLRQARVPSTASDPPATIPVPAPTRNPRRVMPQQPGGKLMLQVLEMMQRNYAIAHLIIMIVSKKPPEQEKILLCAAPPSGVGLIFSLPPPVKLMK
jgi:hypothetical protein